MEAVEALHGRARTRSAVLVVVSVLALALNLRMSIASVGPVLPAILRDLHAGLIFGSLLTTAPVVMMGLAAPLSSRVAGRIGMEWLLAWSLALITVGTLARVWATSAALLLCSAIVIGGGISAGNTMLPAVVRTYFPRQTALMTGVCIVGINVGASFAALGTPRIETALSTSWPAALAAWGAVGGIAGILWLGLAVRHGTRPRSVPHALPWRFKRAWLMTLFFGLQSMIYYAIFAWLAPLYEEHGWVKEQAGLLLSAFAMSQIIGVMLASAQVQRTGSLSTACRATASITMVGLVLIAVTPLSWPWVWVALLGLGTGGIFPLSMLLPISATTSVADARRWTAMMLYCGYIIGASGPFFVAVLRSTSGSFLSAYLALACACLVLLAVTPRVAGSPLVSSPTGTHGT